MITVTFRRSRSSRGTVTSTAVDSKVNKTRILNSRNMPSLGRVPELDFSAVTVTRTKVKFGPSTKNKLELNKGFLSFYPIKWFVRNCWFESNRLNWLSFQKQVIWT